MDDKGRIFMPAAFRRDAPPEILASEFHVSPEKEAERGGFLIARPHEEWKSHLESIQRAPVPRRTIREYLKIQNALSQKTTLDRQNRLVLSPQMRTALNLEAEHGKVELVLVGAGTYFEIWLADRFEGEEALLDKAMELRDQLDSVIDNHVD